MTRRVLTWLLVAGALVAVAGTVWQMASGDQAQRYKNVRNLGRSPSGFTIGLSVDYAAGPVARESYSMFDDDGRSDASYAVVDRAGTTARFHETVPGYGVSFLFERLVADGIWELTDKPPRGNTAIRYRTSVEQTVAGQHGARTAAFTDPHYWATTAGRQFRIHLERGKPVPADVLSMDSTSIADPRYERVVRDFRNFGSPAFRSTIRQARARLGLAP